MGEDGKVRRCQCDSPVRFTSAVLSVCLSCPHCHWFIYPFTFSSPVARSQRGCEAAPTQNGSATGQRRAAAKGAERSQRRQLGSRRIAAVAIAAAAHDGPIHYPTQRCGPLLSWLVDLAGQLAVAGRLAGVVGGGTPGPGGSETPSNRERTEGRNYTPCSSISDHHLSVEASLHCIPARGAGHCCLCQRPDWLAGLTIASMDQGALLEGLGPSVAVPSVLEKDRCVLCRDQGEIPFQVLLGHHVVRRMSSNQTCVEARGIRVRRELKVFWQTVLPPPRSPNPAR